jgi:hypothetical protein
VVGRGAIDYKGLRGFNAEAARRAVLEYLKTNANISETARMFGITSAVVCEHVYESYYCHVQSIYARVR